MKRDVDLEVLEYLDSYDLPHTNSNKVAVVEEWISNLESHVETWKLAKRDFCKEALAQIADYKAYLATIF